MYWLINNIQLIIPKHTASVISVQSDFVRVINQQNQAAQLCARDFVHLFLHYWVICTSIWHQRDKLGTGKLSPLILCSAVREEFCLTDTWVCPSMFRLFSPENGSNTFSHRSVQIATWNMHPHPDTVCFHPFFQCVHEQVNLIHDCRRAWRTGDRHFQLNC